MKRIPRFALLMALFVYATVLAQAQGLSGGLNLEIGAVSIGGVTYSKAVISPEVQIGKLKLGFYLPAVYSENLFDPSTWYAPGGNNEWDFGALYWDSDTWLALKDLAADIALKVKYVEYGQPLEDVFFVKAGNLSGLTIGHGLIMRNYRNDGDFPSLRRLGLNLGMDFGAAGFEALANDLIEPEILGARLYFRPIPGFGLALGASGVVDLEAGKDLVATTTWGNVADKLVFIGSGLDLDLPIVASSEVFGLRAFADAAVTLPYVKNDFASPLDATKTITSGLKTELLWDGALKNWGASAGLLGKVFFIDWRLEYRYFTGVFRPSFFDSTYERNRSDFVAQYVDYLDGSGAPPAAPTTMGIYGEAGVALFGEKLKFGLSYMWPWDPDRGFAVLSGADDEFHAGLAIKKGLIPLIDIAGAVYYDKKGLAASLYDGSFVFFDSNTAFAGEIEIPLPNAPGLSAAAIFKAVAARNAAGEVIYIDPADPAKGIKIVPSVTLETRFRF